MHGASKHILSRPEGCIPHTGPTVFFTEDEIIAFFMECDRMPDTPYLKGRHLIAPRDLPAYVLLWAPL
ncbi:hypothetical protein LC724_06330 [Blautia sp. RD014234]|nr:hypothetical protein [Blautia parvula]